MKKFFQKLSLLIFIAANLFSLGIEKAHADMTQVMLGNPLALKDELMNSFGVNQSELKNMVQTFNTIRQKVNPPQVMLTFDPANPVPGEKVTVTATPTYFMNTYQNMYFTWYIKNAKCTDEYSDKSKYKYNQDCDLDGNNVVDIEDYKIKAARIIAGNDFTWDTNGDGKPNPTIYGSDTDDDGYQASLGGNDQKGKTPYCYIRDIASGNDYPLSGCENDKSNMKDAHLFAQSTDDTTGDGSFGKSEESFWHTNPNAKDTAGTGNTDEANVTGLGVNSLTFTYTTGDKVGVAVEGISVNPNQTSDSSYETMWAFSKNDCTLSDLNDPHKTDYPQITGPTTVTTNEDPSPGCIKTVTTKTTKYVIAGTEINNYQTIRTRTQTTTTIDSCTDPSANKTAQTVEVMTCPQGDAGIAQSCPTSDPANPPSPSCSCSGVDSENQQIISNTNLPSIQDLNNCLYKNLVTPAEGGGAKQKMDVALTYSPQNPINDSSDLKNGDTLSFDATVTGAQNPDYLNYEWQVYKGDAPDTDTWTQISKTDLPGATQTIGLEINTFKFNLNFPAAPPPPTYLKVKLIVTDNISTNEIKEGHTDVVIPLSSADKRISVYPTTVSFNGTTPVIATDEKDTQGNDKELCMLTLTDPNTNKTTTTPSAVCEVAKNEILAIKIDNTKNGYANFLWAIDGKPNTCPDANFQGCLSAADKNGNQAQTAISYFPVLKEIGDQFTINLSAVDKDGKQINLSRAFKVVDPSVKITPTKQNSTTDTNKVTCLGVLLGNYIDLTGRAWPDRSETDFQALTENNITLTPKFSAGLDLTKDEDRKKYSWIVDGNTITENNVTEYGGYSIDKSTGALTLPPKNYNETYAIDFSTLYTQSKDKKQVLNKYWNVGYNDFYEKQLKHSVQIKMVSVQVAKTNTSQQKILATISAGIPSYIAFLFRIALAGFVILFSTRILFFILPKTNNNYNEF